MGRRKVDAGLFLVHPLVHRRREDAHVVAGRGGRRFACLMLAAAVVEDRFGRLDNRAELLDEAGARALELVDLGDELLPPPLRVGDDLLGLQLRLGEDDVRLLARVGLHLLGEALRRGQRLLQQLLAVLELVDARLAPPQFLVLAVELALQVLELRGHEVEVLPNLFLVDAAEAPPAERLLPEVERSELHGSEDTTAVKDTFLAASGSAAWLAGAAPRTPPRRSALTQYMEIGRAHV